MAKSDGTAVYVYTVGIELHLPVVCNRYDAEGFVEFKILDVFQSKPCFCNGFWQRFARSSREPFRRLLCVGKRKNLCQRLDTKRISFLLAHQHDGRGAVVK